MDRKVSRNPEADKWKGILMATVVIMLLVSAGFLNHYFQVKQFADSAEPIIQDLSAERRALARQRDSLEKLARLRHPDTRWLARVIYSETKQPHEQRLVAWVVRNRVESHFRGKDTYREVALDSKQFSAFNRGNGLREYYITKNTSDLRSSERKDEAWARALVIADKVRRAPAISRPFSRYTFYFYSQVSMPSWKPHPEWKPLFDRVDSRSMERVDPMRFRFYKDPECRLCGNESGRMPNDLLMASDSSRTNSTTTAAR